MKVVGIIPARFASSRFPGKALANILGKSMIQRVYEQSLKSEELNDLYVATDDKRIFEHVHNFNGKVIMTSKFNKTGTERTNEAINKLKALGYKFDIVVNIQGDEPFIQSNDIDKLVKCFYDNDVKIATLYKKSNSSKDFLNKNIVKLIFDKKGFALYFSRSPMPFQENKNITFYKHIGIYAFKINTLNKIVKLPEAPLEKYEKLEQLRWLENGFKIKVSESENDCYSVDVPEDIDRIVEEIKKGKIKLVE